MTRHHYLYAVLAAITLVFSCKEPVVNDVPEKESPKDPVLTVSSSVQVDGKAGQYAIPFTLENPSEGVSVSASCECDWIFDVRTADNQILFNASDNLRGLRRTSMTVSYGENIRKTVTVMQDVFSFPSFSISAKEITTRGAKVKITPKAYKEGYFFEVFSKSSVDSFTSLDVNSLGDMGYADALYKDDLSYLQKLAHESGLSLAQLLSRLPNMYKQTTTGESTEMSYSDLKQDTDYYAIVYGMDASGTRTTEVCLFLFTTLSPATTDLTFTGSVSGLTQTAARVSITPSNTTDTYYWTFATETDMAQYSLDVIMNNMIANVKEYAKSSGVPLVNYLSKGLAVENLSDLSMGTRYTIIAWGMDANGDATTAPQEVFTFTTKTNDITDNCTFGIEFTTIEAMDVKAKISPSNSTTRYYVAFIDEKRCVNYNDYQMVTRIVNMESERIRLQYYGPGVTWDNLPGILSGENEVWGRRDLGWSFEPEHSYRVYVFGLDGNGNVTTTITRKDVKTVAPEASNITFTASLNAGSSWHIGQFDIVPSNNDEYYMPFLVKTSDLDSFRYNDGSLMEREVMDRIRDIYEDEISQYVHKGKYTFVDSWTSDTEYSLLLFGYAGSNTTPMYEFRFKSPAIPFGKADCDISYTYELFNGDDLAAMAPAIWGNSKGECVMKVNIAVSGNPANYYFGLWPPKENFASTGGIDHLVMLCQNELTTGDNIINKTFGVLKPWWDGPGMGEGIFVTEEGEVLEQMPWSITAYAEDANHNYGPLHYEIFTPIQKPEAQVTGKYNKGYREPYDFWSSPAAANSNIKTMILRVQKPQLED